MTFSYMNKYKFSTNLLNFWFLLKDSFLLIIFKSISKVLLLGFVVIVANYLTQEEFGDFQFTISLTNICVQPMIIISMIITRIGCNYPLEKQGNHLRWLHDKLQMLWILGIVLLIGSFYLIDPLIAKIANIEASKSITIAGITIAFHLLFFYYLGFLQALEAFKEIALVFCSVGCFTLILGFTVIFWNLGIRFIYLSQAIAVMLTVTIMSIMVDHQLPKQPIRAQNHDFLTLRFCLLMLFSICVFFILNNMDIIAVKIMFNRSQAGYYGRLELISKFSFILSSSIAMVIFPRISKIYEQGKDPVAYLIKGTALYFLTSILVIVLLLLFSGNIVQMLYRKEFTGDITIVLLISIAKMFLSYIFIVINYESAVVDLWLGYLLGGLLVVQSVMFWLNHNTLHQIATNIAVSSILGAIIFLGHIVFKRRYHGITFNQ